MMTSSSSAIVDVRRNKDLLLVTDGMIFALRLYSAKKFIISERSLFKVSNFKLSQLSPENYQMNFFF